MPSLTKATNMTLGRVCSQCTFCLHVFVFHLFFFSKLRICILLHLVSTRVSVQEVQRVCVHLNRGIDFFLKPIVTSWYCQLHVEIEPLWKK